MKCKSTLLSFKVSGNRATGRFESTYENSDAAKRMADDLKKALDKSKNKMNDVESFDVSSSGRDRHAVDCRPGQQKEGRPSRAAVWRRLLARNLQSPAGIAAGGDGASAWFGRTLTLFPWHQF